VLEIVFVFDADQSARLLLIAVGRELLPTDPIFPPFDVGSTRVGEYHEEESLSDGRHRRILCTFIRG
jgi:hypothetical protein